MIDRFQSLEGRGSRQAHRNAVVEYMVPLVGCAAMALEAAELLVLLFLHHVDFSVENVGLAKERHLLAALEMLFVATLQTPGGLVRIFRCAWLLPLPQLWVLCDVPVTL